MRDLPLTLSDVITLCVKVDEHLRARRGTGNYITQRHLGHMEMALGGGATTGGGNQVSDSMEEGEQPM